MYKIVGKSFQYEVFDFNNYKPLWKVISDGHCCNKFFKQYNIHLRVVVTVPLGRVEAIYGKIKNDSRFIFIIHHAEVESRQVKRDILTWNNSFMAAELASLTNVFPPDRTFTPSAMSISPQEGITASTYLHGTTLFRCTGIMPIGIVHGAISKKRDMTELKTIFRAGRDRLHVKVLTTNLPSFNVASPEYGKLEWIRKLNMTAYHEKFQTASFLIAGMTPESNPDYFSGHPSSNIAYAIHFGLPIIGHKAIFSEYLALHRHNKTAIPVGFWHNGSPASIRATTFRALRQWYNACRSRSKHL